LLSVIQPCRARDQAYLLEPSLAPGVDVELFAVELLPDGELPVPVELVAPEVLSVPPDEAPSEPALFPDLLSSFSFFGGMPVDDLPRLSVT
jgi:hypothetical protein